MGLDNGNRNPSPVSGHAKVRLGFDTHIFIAKHEPSFGHCTTLVYMNWESQMANVVITSSGLLDVTASSAFP